MKLLSFFLCLFIGSILHATNFRLVSDYGTVLYKVLDSYIDANPGCSPYKVRSYMHSNSGNAVFREARSMGYAKYRVIQSCYAISIQNKETKEILLTALKQDLQEYNMWIDVCFWGAVGCSSFSALVALYACGFFIFYFRYDRQVINHYRHQNLGGFFPALHRD